MKILLTTDTLGGVWNFSLSLARALKRIANVDTHFATLGGCLSAAQRLEIAEFPFEESDFPLEWMPGSWDGVDRAGKWLLTLEQKIKPAVIHHNTVALGHLPFQAPSVVTVHSCVLSWWEAVQGESAPADWDEYRRRVTRSLQRASEIVAPGYEMLSSARRLYGLGNWGQVIPNFVETPEYSREKQPLIFAAGRVWDQAKNLAALERAASGLAWPVVIAGEGGSLGHLPHREVQDWCSRASIYAWPAKYEPFGLSILEAASHGCCLVLGDIPSLRENWEGAALFVETEQNLHLTLARLIADEPARRELGRLARQRAKTFSAQVTVKQYCAAYQRALSENLPVSRAELCHK